MRDEHVVELDWWLGIGTLQCLAKGSLTKCLLSLLRAVSLVTTGRKRKGSDVTCTVVRLKMRPRRMSWGGDISLSSCLECHRSDYTVYLQCLNLYDIVDEVEILRDDNIDDFSVVKVGC